MNRIAITVYIDVPDGVTPDVSYGAVSPARPAGPSGPPPAVASSTAAGWVCPEHGSEKIRQWPDGGISCGVRGGNNVNDKGYCRHRWSAPKPGQGPAQYVPASELSELPFG
jgi:hypothetical protein